MKVASLLTGLAMVGLVTVSDTSLHAFNPSMTQVATAAEAKADVSTADKIAEIAKLKGKPGSADLMRKYYKDLSPIGIQPGGAGMVVNLYSKKDDTTLSLCTVFDVVVAVKKGKIAKFQANEVK